MMPTQADRPIATQSFASQVVSLALRGLVQMFSPERKLFYYSMLQSGAKLVPQGISPRYTMMTLLGLHRAEQAGLRSPIAIIPVLERMLGDTSWITSIGDLGLLLWTCSEVAPERFDELANNVAVATALQRYEGAKQGNTMEMAWFLSGLAHGLNQGACSAIDFTKHAETAYQTLAATQGAKGLFGHLSRDKSLTGRLRGKIGSFADQVYPIYAFSQYAKFTGQPAPLTRARECAETICQYQGPCGEWWWHYDSVSGELAETYPVYSVHQDGMAPMALFALGEVTGIDFSGPILKGLDWIRGNNALKLDMQDAETEVIWRNFYLPDTTRLLRHITGAARKSDDSPIGRLKVNHECRPYELGWAIYGLAGHETSLTA